MNLFIAVTSTRSREKEQKEGQVLTPHVVNIKQITIKTFISTAYAFKDHRQLTSFKST